MRRTALDSWHRDRHTTETAVPWLTLPKAREEIAAIKDQMAAEELALVAENDEYLDDLAVNHATPFD